MLREVVSSSVLWQRFESIPRLLEAGDDMEDHKRTPLIDTPRDRGLSNIQREEDASSIVQSHVTEEEQMLADASVGERLA